jgi:hypothetical protein
MTINTTSLNTTSHLRDARAALTVKVIVAKLCTPTA